MIFPKTNNKTLESTLKNIIESKRIPHAFIIEGNEGSNRHAVANYIAAACVCEGEGLPCGECKQCHLLSIGNHTDVITVLPEKDKKHIYVDQIRGVRTEAFILPRLNEHKVFIIDGAQRMNEAAQNALLKVLEEPPKNVVFILIVPSRTMLLSTVVSRCVCLSLQSNEFSKQQEKLISDAKEFIRLLFEGEEYEMLKILNSKEKSRPLCEEFYTQLRLAVGDALKENLHIRTKAKVLDSLYRQTEEYLKLLKTNINLSLLSTAVVARAMRLTK